MGLASRPRSGVGGGAGWPYGNIVLIPFWVLAHSHSRTGLSRLGHLPWLTPVALQTSDPYWPADPTPEATVPCEARGRMV